MNVDRNTTRAQACELLLNLSEAGVALVFCYGDLELGSRPRSQGVLADRLGGVGRKPLGVIEHAPGATGGDHARPHANRLHGCSRLGLGPGAR
jgi:hypothetical protein